MKNKDTSLGKRVLIAATLINFFTGIMYAWSLVSKALVEYNGWSSKEASFPYTIFTIAFPIAMVVFGKFQDDKGPRISALIGTSLVGLGFILAGLFLSPPVMVLTIGIMVGAGIGMITISTTPPVMKWFHPSMKGKVTGIVVSGVGLSALLYSPLASFLITRVGVSKTLIYIGLLVLLTSLGLSTRLSNPPHTHNFGDFKAKEDYLVSKDLHWEKMLKTKEFYMLWLMIGLSSSAGLLVIAHISNIGQLQVGWDAGFVLVMVLAVFNSLGRIIGGYLSDKIGRVNTLRLLFTLQAFNMLIFRTATTIPIMLVASSMAGFCYGAGFSVFPAAIGDLYGMKHFGLNYGLLFTGWGLGGIIGPLTGAAVFDASGNYSNAFVISFILLLISIFITIIFNLGKKHRSKEKI